MVCTCHWCGSHRLSVKINIQVVEMHVMLTMNGILNDFLKKGHS